MYIGMRVRIANVDNVVLSDNVGNQIVPRQPHPEHTFKLGTITEFETVDFTDGSIDTPVITLDDNTVLRGYECWWEPVEEQKSI